jgi:2-haloacid dehalogenase
MSGNNLGAFNPRAYLFDAYGTLFDVYSVAQPLLAALPCEPRRFLQLWRQKQLEYTWLKTLMERYADFWHVTEAALLATARELSIELTGQHRQQLMEAYLFTPSFDDAKPTLKALGPSPRAILSNGTPAMLNAAVQNSGMESFFTEIISVERVSVYKPSPRVYALGPELLQIPADEILFVSSNWWDAAGAKAFGYRVCWCNRAGSPPEDLGFAPDIIIRSLTQLAGK